jgi:hypothetical protein
MGDMRYVYRISIGKPEGKNHLGDLGIDGKIKINFKETGSEDVEWNNLGQDTIQWRALVNTVTNLGAPSKAANFLTS